MEFNNLLLVSVLTITYLRGLMTCIDNSQSRDKIFREKYFGKQYSPWEKVHQAENITLANICLKFFSLEKKEDEGAAEAYILSNRTVLYGQFDEVTFDMVQCKLRYRNVRQQITGEGVYYLAEGNDGDSAFKFFLINGPKWPSVNQLRIVLGGVVRNIWNQTISPSALLGSRSKLDIDFYKD